MISLLNPVVLTPYLPRPSMRMYMRTRSSRISAPSVHFAIRTYGAMVAAGVLRWSLVALLVLLIAHRPAVSQVPQGEDQRRPTLPHLEPAAPHAGHVSHPPLVGDELWSDIFKVQGPDSRAHIMSDGNDNVIAVGSFTTVDGDLMDGLARWDGSAWYSMGSGLSRSIAAAAYHDGSVYVASALTGFPYHSVVRWSDGAWEPLGGLPFGQPVWGSGFIHTFAFDQNGTVFIGGTFRTMTTSHRGVAYWDGSDWVGLIEPAPQQARVAALAFGPDGHLYAGGEFQFQNNADSTISNIGRWDGEAWHPLGTGLNGQVSSISLDAEGHLLVGGVFSSAGGQPANNIARWDGTDWQSLGNGLTANGTSQQASVGVISVHGNEAVVAGTFNMAGETAARNVARWDGTLWHPLGAGTNRPAGRIATTSDGSVYFAGDFTLAGDHAVNRIARWRDGEWHPVSALSHPHGINGTVNTLAIDGGGGVYVGGYFTLAGSSPASGIARWDGSTWHALGSAESNPFPYHLQVDAEDQLYAAGSFPVSSGIRWVGRWDGTEWQALGSPPAAWSRGWARRLAFAPDGTLYVGGANSDGGQSNIAQWDGTAWTSLDGVTVYDLFDMLIDHRGHLVVGGRFALPDHEGTYGIIRWDGTGWSTLGSRGNERADAMAEGPDGELYVTGSFYHISPSMSLGRWDGSDWTDIGAGHRFHGALFYDTVSDHLYSTSWNPNRMLMRWDGDSWEEVSTVTGAFSEIERFGEYMWVSGGFTSVGGTPSARIGQWSGLKPVGTAPSATLPGDNPDVLVFPNPTSGATTLSFVLPSAEWVTAGLYDVLGRRVAVLLDDRLEAGEHLLDWDVRTLAPGPYIVRIVGGSVRASGRVLVIR
jgi:trimeric autotransporter adhesin